MHVNESTPDRILRAVLGTVLLAIALAVGVEGAVKVVLLVLAGVALLTAAVGFCPLYRVVGISTCKR